MLVCSDSSVALVTLLESGQLFVDGSATFPCTALVALVAILLTDYLVLPKKLETFRMF